MQARHPTWTGTEPHLTLFHMHRHDHHRSRGQLTMHSCRHPQAGSPLTLQRVGACGARQVQALDAGVCTLDALAVGSVADGLVIRALGAVGAFAGASDALLGDARGALGASLAAGATAQGTELRAAPWGLTSEPPGRQVMQDILVASDASGWEPYQLLASVVRSMHSPPLLHFV